MADVTGPISTLPGSSHDVPKGTMCDEHPERTAVSRIQGETDSMGSEMIDCCQECRDEILSAVRKGRSGLCEWCKGKADDLREARDYDEGLSGRVYDVCGECRERQKKRLIEEADEFDRQLDDLEDDVSEDDLDDLARRQS